jgi:hypothetical protein
MVFEVRLHFWPAFITDTTGARSKHLACLVNLDDPMRYGRFLPYRGELDPKGVMAYAEELRTSFAPIARNIKIEK